MAHVQWCVGNTTLREAARLKGGLRILKEYFDGKPWSYENQEKERDVYSLFIAPQIHINTAVHFYAKMTSVPHINSSGEKVYPKIIPLSLDEYILLLRIFQKKRYLPLQLKKLLNDIIALKNKPDITDGSHWLNYIRGCIVKWSERL